MIRRIALALALGASAGIVMSASTPAETRARAEDIRATAQALAAEVQDAAGGDYQRWHQQLAAFRANLWPRLESAIGRTGAYRANPTTVESPLLKVPGTPPLFEMPGYGVYVAAPNTDNADWLDNLEAVKTFIAVSRWLKSKDIDLIVVPTPRIPEAYGDMLAPAPKTTTVAPWLKGIYAKLLAADVEVVDLMPVFTAARRVSVEPLYLAADGHWSDRAQRLAAVEIARRVKRYAPVAAALRRPALFKATPTRVALPGALFPMLSDAEKAEVRPAVTSMPLTLITTVAGVPFEEPSTSPVMVIGDSLTHYFQLGVKKGSGIDALLSKEINLAVSNVSAAGATIAPIKEFLRRPELLSGRRVVVWILSNSLLVEPKDAWALPNLTK